jgi:DNA-binding NarL/FixJ family response regulator
MRLAETELKHMDDGAASVDYGTEQLTPRQRQVAILVAQGLTNRQIARELVVTERAAANHIEHILNRLQMNTRTEIGVWAAEQGLLPKKPKKPTTLTLVRRVRSSTARRN